MPPQSSRLLTRRAALAAAGAAALAAAGPSARAADARVIRIGYQRYGTLIILKHRGTLEPQLAKSGVRVEWIEFVAGPQMLQAMGAGAIDFGITGDAPPIFAQAASPRVVYVAHEPPAPDGEAIIVPASSPIRTIADLKGHQVALNRGSNVHWLLLAALAHVKLTVADIVPVYLTPAAARPAFATGRLASWAIWDPYLAAAELSSPSRVVTTAAGLVGNRQFFLAERGFADRNPAIIHAVMAQIAASDAWSEAHKPAVAAMLAADTGLPLPVVRRSVDRLTFGPSPMDAAVIAEQQRIADAFAAQNLIPGPIRVADAIWKG